MQQPDGTIVASDVDISELIFRNGIRTWAAISIGRPSEEEVCGGQGFYWEEAV